MKSQGSPVASVRIDPTCQDGTLLICQRSGRDPLTIDLYLIGALPLAAVLCAVLGGNNFSTCLGASLGAGIVRMSDAMIIASVGLLAGALFEGYKLSSVLGGQILPVLSTQGLIVILIVGLAVMAVVTLFHLPLSLSQVLVGAGWGLALASGIGIAGSYSLAIVASWILSPMLGFCVSAVIEKAMLRFGRRARDVLSLNRTYARLTLIAGFYAAYTLGANTLGLVVGLFSSSLGDLLPLSIMLSAATVAGIVFLSKGTVRSVADNLVGLSPSMALSAQFGGAVSVHVFTELSLPVSISQVVIGGMSGTASAKQMAITNKRIVQQVLAGWTIGPLAGVALSFLLMKLI
jgi:phosphate/sulfate permease